MSDTDPKGIDALQRGSHPGRALVVAILLLLPPLCFWIIIQAGYTGDVWLLTRFWRYIPHGLLKPLVILLPIPGVIAGVFSSIISIRQRQIPGMLIGLSVLTISTVLLVFVLSLPFS